MTPRLAAAACLAAALAGPRLAHAQASGTGTGTCSGMITGTVGLVVPDSPGSTNLESVQAAYIPTAFGNAECLCATTDIQLDIFLTAALPSGTLGTVEVWVGNGCDNYTTRTTANQTACEKLSVANIDINRFTTGGTVGHIYIPIAALALTSPIVHQCENPTNSNAVYVFLYSNPQMPFASCTLQLNEVNQGPGAPASATATSGDKAITVSWSPPPTTETQPNYFQILCANGDGTPVAGKGATQQYSTCLPDGNGGVLIKRRPLPTGGSLGTGGSTDLGVVSTDFDLGGTASAPLGPDSVPPQPTPQDTDGGTAVDMAPASGTPGQPTESGLDPPFDHLDPAYICSGAITVSGTSYTSRIDGLTNGQTYQFVVLAIDNYGNATPTDVLTAIPEPVEDLYRRYRDQGGTASGFCFIATAAFGSYEHRYVRVLRDFRDRVLLPTGAGSAFVSWYYAHSPRAARYIAEHGWARALTRALLWPVIGVAAAWLYTAAWMKGLALALCAAAWWWRRRRAMPATRPA